MSSTSLSFVGISELGHALRDAKNMYMYMYNVRTHPGVQKRRTLGISLHVKCVSRLTTVLWKQLH